MSQCVEVPKLSVALVQMPFAVTAWPSLALSLLKSILVHAGHTVRVVYLNNEFNELIGEALYSKIARGAPQNIDLLGEWLFAEALWGPDITSDQAFKHEVICGGHAAHRKEGASQLVRDLLQCMDSTREKSNQFIEDCAQRDWSEFDVVGFTSTFQQHVASLALAKRLKARWPRLDIVFGGANCESGMGLATLRNFPFVDAVCLGEGDAAFPNYLAARSRGEKGSVAGIVTQAQVSETSPPHTPASTKLDELPYPDFDDFFECAPKDNASYAREHRLVFETSRGCWWGQKNHCTFCGLNGNTLAFRQKTGERAVAELQHLLDKYGRYTRQVTATDNILPYNYFRSFLPQLAALSMKLSLFYETKANLKKEQVELYRAAGLTAIQPGIESLSTPVLRLMRKGVAALQNIQLLKWCQEAGIEVKWNFLAGFPGEQAEWYQDIPDLVRKIKHLPPPIGVSTLRFDRFSPYHNDPTAFGIARLEPYPAYRYIYRDLPESEIEQLAYYFIEADQRGIEVPPYVSSSFAEINQWKDQSVQHALFHVTDEDSAIVFDLRGLSPKIVRLKESYFHAFIKADAIVSTREIEEDVAASNVDGRKVLSDLVAMGILIQEGAQWLGVSVSLEREYWPPQQSIDKLRHLYAQEEEGNGTVGFLNIRSEHISVLGDVNAPLH